jgi:osmotically-inducible protein OsmY
MIPKICACLAILLLLATVCLAADKPVTDDWIYDQVVIKLANDKDVRGGGLKIDVKQGVVTLNGDVEQQSQKSKAEKIAKKIKGVKQVVNNIEVKKHG